MAAISAALSSHQSRAGAGREVFCASPGAACAGSSVPGRFGRPPSLLHFDVAFAGSDAAFTGSDAAFAGSDVAFAGSDVAFAGSGVASPVRVSRCCRLMRRGLGRFRPLRGFLRAYFLLHPLYERRELHDALAQDLCLGFDRGRLFLLRLFTVRCGGAATGHRTECATGQRKPRLFRSRGRRAFRRGFGNRATFRRCAFARGLGDVCRCCRCRRRCGARGGTRRGPDRAPRFARGGRRWRRDGGLARRGFRSNDGSLDSRRIHEQCVFAAHGGFAAGLYREAHDGVVHRPRIGDDEVGAGGRALHVHPAEQELRDAVRVLLRRCNPEAFGRYRFAFAKRDRNDHAQRLAESGLLRDRADAHCGSRDGRERGQETCESDGAPRVKAARHHTGIRAGRGGQGHEIESMAGANIKGRREPPCGPCPSRSLDYRARGFAPALLPLLDRQALP